MPTPNDPENQPTIYFASLNTAEELVDQARRWKAGEKDGHDVIIDHFKQHVRDRMDAQQLDRWGYVLTSDVPQLIPYKD